MTEGESTDEFGNVWHWSNGRATFVRGPRRSDPPWHAYCGCSGCRAGRVIGERAIKKVKHDDV